MNTARRRARAAKAAEEGRGGLPVELRLGPCLEVWAAEEWTGDKPDGLGEGLGAGFRAWVRHRDALADWKAANGVSAWERVHVDGVPSGPWSWRRLQLEHPTFLGAVLAAAGVPSSWEPVPLTERPYYGPSAARRESWAEYRARRP